MYPGPTFVKEFSAKNSEYRFIKKRCEICLSKKLRRYRKISLCGRCISLFLVWERSDDENAVVSATAKLIALARTRPEKKLSVYDAYAVMEQRKVQERNELDKK